MVVLGGAVVTSRIMILAAVMAKAGYGCHGLDRIMLADDPARLFLRAEHDHSADPTRGDHGDNLPNGPGGGDRDDLDSRLLEDCSNVMLFLQFTSQLGTDTIRSNN
jgi:hypothetical protein